MLRLLLSGVRGLLREGKSGGAGDVEAPLPVPQGPLKERDPKPSRAGSL